MDLDQVVEKFPTSPPPSGERESYVQWLRSQNELFKLVLSGIADAVIVALPDGRITLVNPVAEVLFGVTEEDVLRTSLFDFFSTPEGEPSGNQIAQLLERNGLLVRYRTTVRHRQGSCTPIELTFTPLACDGLIVRLVATCRDLTTEEAQRQKLEALALTDPLTGCYNRRWLEAYFAQARKGTRSEHDEIGVIFIDLDNFGWVNKEYEMAAGDDIICRASHAIKASVREGDVVVRFGGDEFLVVIDRTNVQGAKRVADKALQAFRSTDFVIKGTSVSCRVTASIGVAVAPRSDLDSIESLTDLMMRAERAKECAKRAGKDQVFVLVPDVRSEELLVGRQTLLD